MELCNAKTVGAIPGGLFFLFEVDTGGCVRAAVFQPGMDAVAAGDFREAEFIEADIVAAEMGAVGAGWVLHRITSFDLLEILYDKWSVRCCEYT